MFFTRYANFPPFYDCAGGGQGRGSSIFFWNSHYLNVPTHEFAINPPFSRILQSERLRFLESIAKLSAGVYLRARPFSSLVLPFAATHFRRAGQKSLSPSNPRSLAFAESSNLPSSRMMIEFHLVRAVTYNLAMFRRPVSISIPDRPCRRIAGVASSYHWLLPRNLSVSFDAWGGEGGASYDLWAVLSIRNG